MSLINYELKPTINNLKQSILKDMVGRNAGIAHFIEFLDATSGNMAIALDDIWGSGKTFFVKQTQLVMQSYNSSENELSDIKKRILEYFKNYTPKNYFPVYYDAWSNDNDTDPILSIIFKMLQDIEDLEEYEVTDKDWWDRIASGLEVISTTFGGPRIKQFLDSVKGKDILAEIKQNKEVEKILNGMFDLVLGKYPDGTRIVFFIDELDRCCPNFAVRLLERIKHYFLNEKVIFVLSINSLELQHTIKRHYGNDFNADKYLRRFFDFTIPLPAADMEKYYNSIDFPDQYARHSVAKAVIQKYNFSLREITRYLQYLNVAVPEQYYTDFHPKKFFYFDVLIPFLIGLNIHDLKKYNEFINGENLNEFIEVVQLGNPDWYCNILFDRAKETFEKNSKDGRNIISLVERFQPLYECLFTNNSERHINVYRDEIDANDKKNILDTISFMKSSKNLKKLTAI